MDREALVKQIEELRAELEYCIENLDKDSDKILQLSRELDKLIVEYERRP